MGSEQRIKEAIILAGGLGTRLREAVPDLPKSMAPVGGKPFLSYVIDYFLEQGVEKFIFALGYKSEAIEDFLLAKLPGLPGAPGLSYVSGLSYVPGAPGGGSPAGYQLSIENEPLGTGGAIRQACTLAVDSTILVLNGDTFFRIDVDELGAAHRRQAADCSLCLKPMQNFDRYGAVELDQDGRISAFREKQFYRSGLINGGVYALDRARFLQEDLPERFSFEKDYLEKYSSSNRFFGLVQDNYFIDIGIPEDYERAQSEIKDYVI